MNRKEKVDMLLDAIPTAGAEFAVPESPPRFVVLEQDDGGVALWVYFGDNLDELGDAIATSETHFVEHVRIHDLDKDSVLIPVWKVEQFVKLEDDFSYAEGYVTIP
jgi:hypothetical protein